MTKEELKHEAEELYKNWYAHKLGAISIIDVICKMAEPREKRIAELEKERDKYKARCEHYERCIMQMREENEN